jgi:hypothetical protein
MRFPITIDTATEPALIRFDTGSSGAKDTTYA